MVVKLAGRPARCRAFEGFACDQPVIVRPMGMAMKWVISLIAFPSEFFPPISLG
jgi:hypothetical protein